MNYPIHKVVLVVCEGKSETAYLQELNRFLRDEEIPLSFQPHNACNGQYRQLQQAYRDCRRENRKSTIVIWADYDIYRRNESKCRDKHEGKPKGIPDFCFNTENFEDFLALHLPDERLAEWVRICLEQHHFETPMHARLYEPLLRSSVFPDYRKGRLPADVKMGYTSLGRLKRHHADPTIPFRSDFVDFMVAEIEAAANAVIPVG